MHTKMNNKSNLEEIKNKYAHQSINDYVIIYESRGAEQIYLSWEKPTAKNNQQIWYPKIQIAGLILLVNAMWIVILITLGNLLKKESNEESMV